MNDDDDDDWLNNNRSKRTGRILKGRSGNPNGRPRKKGESMPIDLAKQVLAAGETKIQGMKNGRKHTFTAWEASLQQLAIAAAKGDKAALRLFTAHMARAADTIAERKRQEQERLGAYLKARDEGRAWPLDEVEAAYYQRVAKEAGLPMQFRAAGAEEKVQQLTEAYLSYIMESAKLRDRIRTQFVSDGQLEEIARRVVYAERRLQLQRRGRAA